MSAKNFKNILVKGDPIRKEADAGGVITPGHLLLRSAADTVVVHSAAGKNQNSLFALEEDLIGGSIDTNYASGDRCYIAACRPGDEVFALLAASATAVTYGAAVESAGDGTVRIATTDAATDDTQRKAVVGFALEAVDNSGGASTTRILIEVA